MKNRINFLVKVYHVAISILFAIYSYSQVDLNLTLSQNSFYLSFQKIMWWIGFFNRTLSGSLFSILLLLFFIDYMVICFGFHKKIFNKKDFIFFLLTSIFFGLLSFPAFSYDIFNYIFDARIVGKYGLNPYQYKALDFPHDDWTRFMHWTHRTYPYGPVWLLFTVPLYIIGLGKFVLTLFFFKIVFAISYAGTVIYLQKIIRELNKKNELFSLSLFAFHPLIIIESIISPHNEIVMTCLLIFSLYWLVRRKTVKSLLSLLLSVGVKFITVLAVIPVLFFFWKKISFDFVIRSSIIILFIGLIPIFFAREIYPWYLVTLIGLLVLCEEKSFIWIVIYVLSVGSLLRYIPFLFIGDYTTYVSSIQNILTVIPVVVALLAYCFFWKKKSIW